LSAAVREQLIAEIARLQTEDEAADWVHRNLPVKNTLLPVDAEIVETDFRNRLAVIESASAMLDQQLHETQTQQLQETPTQSVAASTGAPFFDRKENSTAVPIVPHGTTNDNERRVKAEDHSPARQGALQVRHDPALPRMRPNPNRSASYPLCPTPRARPQSER
jgi:hypothetical protein